MNAKTKERRFIKWQKKIEHQEDASLKRVEGFGSKDSCCSRVNEGEVYIVSSASTVTLPPVKEGAYLKFIVKVRRSLMLQR